MDEHFRQRRSWVAGLRAAMSSLWRRRHYAVTGQLAATRPKLEPISKVLAAAGRDPATPVD